VALLPKSPALAGIRHRDPAGIAASSSPIRARRSAARPARESARFLALPAASLGSVRGSRGIWTLLLLLFAIVLLPVPALAFGPVAHVDMGLQILAHAAVAGTLVGRVIQRHRDAFLRGTVDPDRVLAKNLAPYERHTHNWDRVLGLLDGARSDRERAAFLGQVCHLAADVVAHNYFVPAKMAESFRFPMARHAYWEMRFDTRVRARGGVNPGGAALGWCRPEHERFLADVLEPTVLGTGFNVRVTGLALDWQRQPVFDRAGALWDRAARTELADDEVDAVRRMAIDAQVVALATLGNGPLFQVDPRGLEPLRRSAAIRRELRGLRRDMSWAEIYRRVEESRDAFRSLVSSAVSS